MRNFTTLRVRQTERKYLRATYFLTIFFFFYIVDRVTHFMFDIYGHRDSRKLINGRQVSFTSKRSIRKLITNGCKKKKQTKPVDFREHVGRRLIFEKKKIIIKTVSSGKLKNSLSFTRYNNVYLSCCINDLARPLFQVTE